jgi:Lrp/AsnC family leucine-responsive transcriptional regulator
MQIASQIADTAFLDDLDLRLLSALQSHARATYAELGAAVGLKPPAVHERVKLGLGLVDFESAYTTSEVSYESFTNSVAALPEVGEVHSVAGEESFVLKVVTRSTAHLDDFLSRLKAVPGIARTKTTIVLSTPFERAGLALEELTGAPA